MKLTLVFYLVVGCFFLSAQESSRGSSRSVEVQRLFKFSGTLTDTRGFTDTVALHFRMYNEPYGGSASWEEIQNVRPDAQGRYTVLLGWTEPGGLPAEVFEPNGAHWLTLQLPGQREQNRILLVELPSTLTSGRTNASASQDKSVIRVRPTEWYLILILSTMFLMGTWMGLVEALRWAKTRTQQTKQYFMPSSRIANLVSYISSRYGKLAPIERNPFGSENQREVGRQDSQEKAP